MLFSGMGMGRERVSEWLGLGRRGDFECSVWYKITCIVVDMISLVFW